MSPSTTLTTGIRAAVLSAAHHFEVQHVPKPSPGPGAALVRVSYTGICGSDFPIVDGRHPRAAMPLILGHEITGILEEPGGSGIPTGTRVAVNPLLPCGQCGACVNGLGHVCRNLRLLGIDVPGSMTEVLAVPVSNLFAFSADAPATEAALAEPLAVAVHAVRRSRMAPGEKVLIFGAGPIGILVALVARFRGAKDVLLVEPSEQRRHIVEALGFRALAPQDSPVARENREATADVVFDCAGHSSVTPALTEAAPVRGRIVIVAVHHGPANIDLRELAFAEQEIIGVRVYEPADFAESVQLIGNRALGLAGVPISEYPLEAVADAFAEARSAAGAVKVIVRSNN
jgi:2-desacetyl-2-hydroxyethyl bacteriochlorophyllide A dehydrogenase